ncbi:MAG: VOC family protein [Halofilum sp. (in: g-proteobacteria)]|nr:VOC family protein [Halofilum sp. (in: g-proteobacteria)]
MVRERRDPRPPRRRRRAARRGHAPRRRRARRGPGRRRPPPRHGDPQRAAAPGAVDLPGGDRDRPHAPPPATARWFDLDAAATRAALAQRPRLLTWVARSGDLERAVARCPWDTGPIRPMRRGALSWRIAFPADGRLLEGGLLPPLIEWHGDAAHPASGLPDAGCSLVGLRALHPAGGRIKEMLAAIGLGDALELHHARGDGPPRLEAEIDTPGGVRVLA